MKTLLELIIQNLAFISAALLHLFYFAPLYNNVAAKVITQILAVLLLLITGFIDGIYFCMEDDK